jgi:hypothetical protein
MKNKLNFDIFLFIFINMRRAFDILINKTHKKEMSILFGEGSYVKINDVKYITNNKTYIVYCKLYTNDPETCIDTYPSGLDFIARECWKYMGFTQNISVLSSIDVI